MGGWLQNLSRGLSQTPHFMLNAADSSYLSRLLGAMLSKLVISKHVQPDKVEGVLRMLGQCPRAWAGLRIRTSRPRMEGAPVMEGSGSRKGRWSVNHTRVASGSQEPCFSTVEVTG